MSDLIWLSEAQMRRIDRISRYRMVCHGWMIAGSSAGSSSSSGTGCGGAMPADYGPFKTIYNRFIRWGLSGISCVRPVSSLADGPLAEDDGELGLGLEPLARRPFPFLGCVVENQI